MTVSDICYSPVTPLVVLTVNNAHCVVLRVLETCKSQLVALGCFRGDELQFRVRKNRESVLPTDSRKSNLVDITVWHSNGDIVEYPNISVGTSYRVSADGDKRWNAQLDMLLDCVCVDYGIPVVRTQGHENTYDYRTVLDKYLDPEGFSMAVNIESVPPADAHTAVPDEVWINGRIVAKLCRRGTGLNERLEEADKLFNTLFYPYKKEVLLNRFIQPDSRAHTRFPISLSVDQLIDKDMDIDPVRYRGFSIGGLLDIVIDKQPDGGYRLRVFDRWSDSSIKELFITAEEIKMGCFGTDRMENLYELIPGISNLHEEGCNGAFIRR